jgi:hypothetical protein
MMETEINELFIRLKYLTFQITYREAFYVHYNIVILCYFNPF